MTRKSLLTILIFFIAASSFWFFSIKKDFKETKELLAEQKPAPARVVTKEVTRTIASTLSEEKRNQIQNDLQSLQQKLAVEQQRLTSQNQTLENLRTRQAQEQPVNYASQIQERSQQVDILVAGLRDYRRAEDDLSRKAAAALREQSSSANAARDQLDENIRRQEALIRQTEEQLDYWSRNYNYYPERQAHLDELQPLIDAQRQRLQEMRAQRLELSSNTLLQTRATQADVEQVSSSYSQDQDDMTDEIGTLRVEIRRLQQEQARSRMSMATLNSQITQAQRDYRSQAQQVEALQNEIRQKQEQLTKVE